MALRIAILFEFPTLSGGEHSMLAALERLEGAEVIAVAPGTGPLADRLRGLGIELAPLDFRRDGRKRTPEDLLPDLSQFIQRWRPDVLHANSLSLTRLTGALRGRWDVPCSGHLRDIMKLSGRAVQDLNQNDALVAVSQATQDFHVAQGLDASRTTVISNGVDTDRFRPVAAESRLRGALGLPASAVLIGTVGQICLRKGHDLLPRVAERLPCREREIHFCVVGERFSAKAESVAFDDELTAAFAELGLAGHLHRLGYRDDVPELLNEFSLLLHPARQEPLGRVLLEAAACGRPVVATDVGGTPEILEHGESGLLFPVDDAGQAAEWIGWLLADSQRGAALGARARERVCREFRVEQCAERLRGFWERVAGGSG